MTDMKQTPMALRIFPLEGPRFRRGGAGPARCLRQRVAHGAMDH